MPKTEETWMDEKKVREAIEYLSGYIQSNIKLMEETEGIVWIGEEQCKTAIKALKKQLPKKPEKDGVTGVFHPINGIDGVPYDLCPNCYSNLCTTGMFGRDKERMKYCEKCGQRLDWSE